MGYGDMPYVSKRFSVYVNSVTVATYWTLWLQDQADASWKAFEWKSTSCVIKTMFNIYDEVFLWI